MSLRGERVARAQLSRADYKSSRLPPPRRLPSLFKMLARTSTLAIVASLAAVVVAAPWGDGEDIKFIEVKKINDDKFKKTKFNVHDATEHDKNFNQIDAKNKDLSLKAHLASLLLPFS
uniref:Uncharacterized protein n=1 Tax=Leucosporidium scottii TaxID=5278 RepID=A0A0H5FSB1_9BASI|nr:hypothetical protein [Leucosporidium scottii]